MSGVAFSLDGSARDHSERGVIPMSTADKLQNLARYKLLPLKQKNNFAQAQNLQRFSLASAK